MALATCLALEHLIHFILVLKKFSCCHFREAHTITMPKFFKIKDDEEVQGRWWLNLPRDLHGNEIRLENET